MESVCEETGKGGNAHVELLFPRRALLFRSLIYLNAVAPTMHQKNNAQAARSPISAIKCLSYGSEILEGFLYSLTSALAI